MSWNRSNYWEAQKTASVVAETFRIKALTLTTSTMWRGPWPKGVSWSSGDKQPFWQVIDQNEYSGWTWSSWKDWKDFPELWKHIEVYKPMCHIGLTAIFATWATAATGRTFLAPPCLRSPSATLVPAVTSSTSLGKYFWASFSWCRSGAAALPQAYGPTGGETKNVTEAKQQIFQRMSSVPGDLPAMIPMQTPSCKTCSWRQQLLQPRKHLSVLTSWHISEMFPRYLWSYVLRNSNFCFKFIVTGRTAVAITSLLSYSKVLTSTQNEALTEGQILPNKTKCQKEDCPCEPLQSPPDPSRPQHTSGDPSRI